MMVLRLIYFEIIKTALIPKSSTNTVYVTYVVNIIIN